MENITGKIEKASVEDGLSKNTGKPFKRFVFLINNKKYSTFDETIGTAFKAGDLVTMQGEQAGQYWNMKTMEKTDQEKIQIKQADGSEVVVDLLRQILAELRNMKNEVSQ